MVFVLRWDHKQTPNKIHGSEEAGGQGKEADMDSVLISEDGGMAVLRSLS